MAPNPWVAIAAANVRKRRDLLAAFTHVRTASVCCFAHLDNVAWVRSGSASGSRVSVRALVWIIAGHMLHHHRLLHAQYS